MSAALLHLNVRRHGAASFNEDSMAFHRSLTALLALVLTPLCLAGVTAQEMPTTREAPTGDATQAE